MRRDILARLPLPMLALSAAYGVWQFQALFVPLWVALLSALAFESVYIALALAPASDPRRATVISLTAVTVSVLYNTLSSLFHIRPALLLERPLWADVALACLHGAPLAIVAYAVADLVLHRTATPHTTPHHTAAPVETPVLAQQVNVTIEAAPALPDAGPLSKTARVKLLARERGVSESAAWRLVRRQPELLSE
jgi:hypothetical protein